jgi:hypothetical protein
MFCLYSIFAMLLCFLVSFAFACTCKFLSFCHFNRFAVHAATFALSRKIIEDGESDKFCERQVL